MLPESSLTTNNDNSIVTTTILPRIVAVIIGMFERVVAMTVVQQRYSFYSWHVGETWLPIFRIGSVPLGSIIILRVVVTVVMFPTGIRHVIATFVLDTPQQQRQILRPSNPPCRFTTTTTTTATTIVPPLP
jgi:hypothetical protein